MQLKCGASKQDITPDFSNKNLGPLFVAGYASMEAPTFEGIHDRIYTRALILVEKKVKIALISVEVVGLFQEFITQIKEDLFAFGYQKENIFIFATHTHAGPDTMGLWGPVIGKSGVNLKFMFFLRNKIVNAVLEAENSTKTTEILHHQFTLENLTTCYREKSVLNSDVNLVKFMNGKELIGTLWTYSAQPEITNRENRKISADYPGIVSNWIEENQGGVALFGLGLCGAQSPIYCEGGYEKLAEFGEKFTKKLAKEINKGKIIDVDRIDVRQRTVDLPNTNGDFDMMFTLEILNREKKEDKISSTVSKLRIGNLHLVMIPGEPFPGLLAPYYEKDKDQIYMTLSHVNDSAGYFIPLNEFALETVEFLKPETQEDFIGHELESMGYEAAQIVKNTVRDLLKYKKILAISCHADDITLFSGGLLRKLTKEGNKLIAVRVTDDYDDCDGLPPEKARKKNKREATKAYKTLGAEEVIHLDYISDHLKLADFKKLRGDLVKLIRKYKPDIVVGFDVNGEDEENTDHVICAQATNDACWQSPFNTAYPEHFEEGLEIHAVAERYLFARNPTVVNSQVDISDVIQDKIAAISEHKTVMVNFFKQYLLSARANNLFVELLETEIPNPIRLNLFIRAYFGEIGASFGARYGEVFNHIDAGLLKDFGEEI